jgi:hypothetical protein
MSVWNFSHDLFNQLSSEQLLTIYIESEQILRVLTDEGIAFTDIPLSASPDIVG